MVGQQLDRLEPLDEAPESASCVDLRQLVQITDQHELAGSATNVLLQRREGTSTDLSRLVDDEHATAGQASAPQVGQVEQQPRDREGGHAGLVPQHSGGLGGQRRPQHGMPRGREGLGDRVQRRGLARAGGGVDDAEDVPVQGQPLDHPDLLTVERRTPGDRVVQCRLLSSHITRTPPGDRPRDQVLLQRQQLDRCVAALPRPERHEPGVRAPYPQDVLPP